MQYESINLAGTWQLIERPLQDGPQEMSKVLEAVFEAIPCLVPGDVSDSLVNAQRMPEPLVGLNFKQFDWIDQRSWWLTRQIEMPCDWADLTEVQLFLDGLDYGADIWLNGKHLGEHHSAFYPFVCDVKKYLQFGKTNTLVVRLTTGRDLADRFKDDNLCRGVPTEAERGYPERGLGQRIFLRKPAYTWGWDWGPYLATCGMTGKAFFKPVTPIQITDVSVVTQLDDKDANIGICVELDHYTLYASNRVDIIVTLTDSDGLTFEVSKNDVFLASGLNHIDLHLTLPNARLWWPNGSGEPHRYQMQTIVRVDGKAVKTHNMACGLRTVSLLDEPGRFAVLINNQPIFIKGGNWIPSDSLYGRMTDDKLEHLVIEAANANFNCLRIWGGGRYEADVFYEACDQQGILLWHDFMSACAPLPADRNWFYQAFEREAKYQIKRLRNRACMMLWCGNNEVSQCYESPGFAKKIQTPLEPGWCLYHQLLPSLIRTYCSHLPYRPTSPYGGKQSVHDPREGDCHHWMVLKPESKYWSNPWYWDTDDVPIFNSEYGYGGPCSMQSTKQYTGSETPNLIDQTGHQHTNTFYDIPRVNFSINEHYRDPENLPLDQYILLGGLCQGLNLGYSLESMRANKHTMGGMFWMYNDTWGENGWSIIDYYQRRKISWYNVKRCLAHQHLLLRKGGQAFGGESNEILLIAINDKPEKLEVQCEWGYQRYEGKTSELASRHATVPAHSHAVIGTMPMPQESLLELGTVVVIPAMPTELQPASWLRAPYRQLNLPKAIVKIIDIKQKENELHVTVQSDVFAHAVYFNVPDDCRLSDHYFDLFAGMKRTLVIENASNIQAQTLKASSVSFA